MKVFGGNGKRQNNSGRGAGTERNGNTEGTHINSGDRGYNNENVERKRPAPAPVPKPKQRQKKKGKGWLIALGVIALIALGVIAYWKLTTIPPDTAQNDPPVPVKMTQCRLPILRAGRSGTTTRSLWSALTSLG